MPDRSRAVLYLACLPIFWQVPVFRQKKEFALPWEVLIHDRTGSDANQCLRVKLLPEDVAHAALFLASGALSKITAQEIIADAG